MNKVIQVDKECPFCGKENTMDVSIDDYTRWQSGLNTQHAFPEMNEFDREIIQSGICRTCQEQIFGRPTPENEDAWGEELGECPGCGIPIYSKRSAVGNTLKCGHCYSEMIFDQDTLILSEEY